MEIVVYDRAVLLFRTDDIWTTDRDAPAAWRRDVTEGRHPGVNPPHRLASALTAQRRRWGDSFGPNQAVSPSGMSPPLGSRPLNGGESDEAHPLNRSSRPCCLSLALPAFAGTLKCPPDSVRVGPACIDKYEASVWNIPAVNTMLIAKVEAGTATLTDLTGGGATQESVSLARVGNPNQGTSCAPSFLSTFPATGNWTAPLYAVSIPGVPPTACVTWFQAEQGRH